MQTDRSFDVIEPGERESFTFNFVNDIATSDTIVSASWTCVAVDGTDANAATCIDGPAAINGDYVSQWCHNFVAGVTYRLECLIQTQTGALVRLWSHVQCLAQA